MNKLQIKVVDYREQLQPIKHIRIKVFQEEQKVAPELEFDDKDATAIQLLAYLDNEPIGTARIRNIDQQTAKIERLAVLPKARKQGIGKQLMEAALEIIANQNKQIAIVHAQAYIAQLYTQLGFEQVGEKFTEAGIPHVKMQKEL